MLDFKSFAPEETIAQVDQANREIAHTIQARSPGWVVLWSVWRRRFSAFGCWTSAQSVIIDAVDAEELIREMQSIMVENWHQSERHA
ncbi:hypothetical protein AB0H88_22435 [Nonomuraea sp. NPDC050680]|uniref:hypothetical protein n=1 Tax=Nonomuraea sp. NPDC050680 TaxID=3154630 RepID=UPI00340F96E2